MLAVGSPKGYDNHFEGLPHQNFQILGVAYEEPDVLTSGNPSNCSILTWQPFKLALESTVTPVLAVWQW